MACECLDLSRFLVAPSFTCATGDIDDTETEAIKVQGKPFWWFSRKNDLHDSPVDEEVPAGLARADTWAVVARQPTKDNESGFTPRRPPLRSASESLWMTLKNTKSDLDRRPLPQKMKSDTTVVCQKETVKSLPPIPPLQLADSEPPFSI